MAHGHPNGFGSAFEHAFGFVNSFLSFYSLVFVGGEVDAVFCSVDPRDSTGAKSPVSPYVDTAGNVVILSEENSFL